ncbi:MAG: hypothetical protein LQ342_001658 [Letrouitia transgressa]|nr:MAG: hypothetical protein LQ342_001658 [Letrouitia transgressa]
MKALIINAQGHSDEAFALAKVALKNAMQSHVCWHVYGLLWRFVKNYEEAIKAYKYALKLEPDSQQIQKDLALLQIQMRDYQGYVQSRRTLLKGRSAFRQNWTALAIAQHLAGDLLDAEQTLSAYEETILASPPPKSDNEHSEALLYKNTIIAEMGDTERALEHLEAIFRNNLDRTAVMEMRAQYLLQLDRNQEAEQAYRALLERNSENRDYYEGLRKSIGIADDDFQSLKGLFQEIESKNPRGDAAKRIPLDFLSGDDFREAANRYLQQMLQKGVPSTFANVKSLYHRPDKKLAIQELVESYVTGMHTPLPNGTANSQNDSEKQSDGKETSFEPSVHFYLAQHYNYSLSRDLSKAMRHIDQAIDVRPDSVDYHMTKARIWKHYGNLHKAAELMEKARSLDTRDRYINTKAAKYQLRNNENDAAIANMAKFTRNEAIGGALGDLHDMQCMWYITEEGEAYLRQQRLGLALKRFTSVYNIFEVWQEDQFDFHTFSLRKGQIRAYVDMIRWEDHLREHPFFSRAAVAAVRVYLKIYDKPHLVHGRFATGMNGNIEGMDSSALKKAQKKAKKTQVKQAEAEAEKKDPKRSVPVGVDGEPKKEDLDPDGSKLLSTSKPLEDAMKFIRPLLEFSPDNIEAQQVGFEVFLRQKKYLLALRCLLAVQKLDTSAAAIHEQSCRLRYTLNALTEPLSSKTSDVLETELSQLVAKDADLLSLNNAYLTNNGESALCVQAALRVRQMLDPSTTEENHKDLIRTLALESSSLEIAIQGLIHLREDDAQPKFQDEYAAVAHRRWPEATAFQIGTK